ncbi:hypothetical protein [Variovorax sp. YR566]|uniref:hypothetical protein n=1 Tax=Variovorax sp. YR566 TaxID=3450237 RepID=UPI003F7E53FC
MITADLGHQAGSVVPDDRSQDSPVGLHEIMLTMPAMPSFTAWLTNNTVRFGLVVTLAVTSIVVVGEMHKRVATSSNDMERAANLRLFGNFQDASKKSLAYPATWSADDDRHRRYRGGDFTIPLRNMLLP